ncbi:hypothetical protein FGO68_gene8048 [Halteria grandinella]|uniref:non-specific serine/threonine protein kinase n=1 Tax=Halteria grandinella TaxID=5974 RepID=A0A8J8NPX7_HALGN|nr:hypothetical protein FGO68_gene8048 [Halteria grandinella]
MGSVKILKQNYKLSVHTQILGAGQFGKVFLSESTSDPNFKVAIKVINKSRVQDQLHSILEEVRILTKLDHPNIVKYYETYDDVRYMYLVMENCPGGELFQKITSQKDQSFNESEAASIMRKLFKAINHCHASGVVHRDIKPENIMYGVDGEIKLIDFGLSRSVNIKHSQLNTVAGTPYYMAPEVFEGEYNQQCDVWSLGVIMYVLLSGYLPFQGDTRQKILSKIMKGAMHFNHPEFIKVSKEGKHLITQLLKVDPNERLTSLQALQHEWFQKFSEVKKGSGFDKLDPSILDRLRNFKGVSTLKKAALNVLIKMVPNSKDINALRAAFEKIDTECTGYISMEELKEALMKNNLQHDPEELQRIIKEVDYHGNNQINYTEFLAATVSINQILTNERLLAVFKQFDTDNMGDITRENLVEAMNKIGQRITNEEIDDIMLKHDISKNGSINFEEFKKLFEEIQ